MRYGSPSIADAIADLKSCGCDRILALPLYPQYASSTTGSALEALLLHAGACATCGAAVRQALSRRSGLHRGARAARARVLDPDGTPASLDRELSRRAALHLGARRPYHCECQKTGRLLLEALQWPSDRSTIAFQSRFGRAEWLKPYTADVLRTLGERKTERVDVVCPGFVSDCLETLEEIALRGKAAFPPGRRSGLSLHRMPQRG
jgi:ferrochelatase